MENISHTLQENKTVLSINQLLKMPSVSADAAYSQMLLKLPK
jgi:hypothetical protein